MHLYFKIEKLSVKTHYTNIYFSNLRLFRVENVKKLLNMLNVEG